MLTRRTLLAGMSATGLAAALPPSETILELRIQTLYSECPGQRHEAVFVPTRGHGEIGAAVNAEQYPRLIRAFFDRETVRVKLSELLAGGTVNVLVDG